MIMTESSNFAQYLVGADADVWEDPGPPQYQVSLFYRARHNMGFLLVKEEYYSRARAEEVALAAVEGGQELRAVGAEVRWKCDSRYVRRCGMIPRDWEIQKQSR